MRVVHTRSLVAVAAADSYSVSKHVVKQIVSDPLASLPASFVFPAAHGVHTLLETYSFSAHNVASHTVSPAFTSSPAAFVFPAAHGVHVLLET